MLNPELLLREDDIKHRHLLVEFEEFDRANQEHHSQVEYYSFKDNSDTLYHVMP
ncbi:replication protein RepL [Salmonella enterica subsp. enterica serovar Kentucky]|nr:replication protein RepL [Salmonella enterica subsp. enterica serovar Kentucky]